MGLLTCYTITKKGTNPPPPINGNGSGGAIVALADAKESRVSKTHAGDGRGAPASAAARPPAAREAPAQSRSLSDSATAKTTNLCDAKKNGPRPKRWVPKKKPGLFFKTGKSNRTILTEETSSQTDSLDDDGVSANVSYNDGDDHGDCDLANVLTSDEDGDNLNVPSLASPTPDQHVPDAMSMLERLGDSPSPDDLANVAAVRANECISECLFADDGHRGGDAAGILDRSKWESIPQYSRSDLMVRGHLGKGSFCDAFEVSVTVAVEEKKLDLSDKDDLDQRIKAKFAWATIREDEVEEEDCDATIDDMFAYGPTPAADEPVDLQPDDDEEHLDAQIDAMFAAAPTPPTKTQAWIPGRVRRHTIDQCVSASFCVGEIQAHKSASDRPVRKKQVTYAMKCLRPQVRSNPDQFIIGIEDLVYETAVLASLDHPNVIQLHGRAASDSFRLNEGYFILLDRLVETLEDRMGYWKALRAAAGGNGSGGGSMVGRRVGPRAAAPPSPPQLHAARSVADALAYLHSRGVAFRDLKPANVGYDARGVLKLFDFGFAALVDGPDGGLRDACGTPRYMAPEVGLGEPYGTPADVHSFGIFLWEVLALERPFGRIRSSEELHAVVFERGLRPKPARGWPRCLREVMAACWAVEPGKRPTMDVVAGVLGAHLSEAASPLPRSGNGGLLKRSLRRLSS